MNQIVFALISTVSFTLSAVAQKGGVAVLDIDEVARQLGVEEKVRVDLLNMQNSLNEELQKTQAAMQTEMSGVEKAAGENPTEDQRRQLVATNQQLNDEFNRIKGQAQQNLAQERVRMISEFRARLEPIALKAAEEVGLEVVLMKVTPPVFAYSKSVDITQSTTKLALEAGLQVKTAAAGPAVEGPVGGVEEAAPAAPEGNPGTGPN